MLQCCLLIKSSNFWKNSWKRMYRNLTQELDLQNTAVTWVCFLSHTVSINDIAAAKFTWSMHKRDACFSRVICPAIMKTSQIPSLLTCPHPQPLLICGHTAQGKQSIELLTSLLFLWGGGCFDLGCFAFSHEERSFLFKSVHYAYFLYLLAYLQHFAWISKLKFLCH